ncbi:MAG: hypothetical protein AABN34_09445 [Acidobacteriota bacterium]
MIGQTAIAEIQRYGKLESVQGTQAVTHCMLPDEPLGLLIVEASQANNI